MGAATMEGISRIRADTYFMGVTGVQAEAGLTTGDPEEAQVKRALMDASAETVVLASSEKLGAVSAWQIHPLQRAGRIVHSAQAPRKMLTMLRRSGVGLVRADGDAR
jgi:DeoR/GlpR family transcriptional regulator of sugar metabolism